MRGRTWAMPSSPPLSPPPLPLLMQLLQVLLGRFPILTLHTMQRARGLVRRSASTPVAGPDSGPGPASGRSSGPAVNNNRTSAFYMSWSL